MLLPDRREPTQSGPTPATGCRRKAWRLVHAQTGREAVAEQHLRRQGFDAWAPTVSTTIRHARRTRVEPRAYFPGYLFVTLDPEHERWRAINGTLGVIRIVTMGDRPLAAPSGFVEALREMLEVREAELAAPLAVGDRVRILSGPFAEQLGVVDRLNPKDRVTVLLDMMSIAASIETESSRLARLDQQIAARPRPKSSSIRTMSSSSR